MKGSPSTDTDETGGLLPYSTLNVNSAPLSAFLNSKFSRNPEPHAFELIMRLGHVVARLALLLTHELEVLLGIAVKRHGPQLPIDPVQLKRSCEGQPLQSAASAARGATAKRATATATKRRRRG